MRSYACIDRIEGQYAVCEVELVTIEESLQLDCSEKETVMLDVALEDIFYELEDVRESDILVVEHDGENVTSICGKDNHEKQRRIENLAAIMGE